MLRRRADRLATALFVVFSLRCAQLATDGYVCTRQADIEAMATMAQTSQPCEGMDQQQPALCHQHAADAAQTFEAVKLPVPGLPAVVQVLDLPLVLEAQDARAAAPAASSVARPPPEPLFLSTLRLRV